MAIKVNGEVVINDDKALIDVNKLTPRTAATDITAGKVVALNSSNQVEAIFSPPPATVSAEALASDQSWGPDSTGYLVRFGTTDRYLDLYTVYNPMNFVIRSIGINTETGAMTAWGPETLITPLSTYGATMQTGVSINDTTAILWIQPWNTVPLFVIVNRNPATEELTATPINVGSNPPAIYSSTYNPTTLLYDSATSTLLLMYGSNIRKVVVDFNTNSITSWGDVRQIPYTSSQWNAGTCSVGSFIFVNRPNNVDGVAVHKIVFDPSDATYGFSITSGPINTSLTYSGQIENGYGGRPILFVDGSIVRYCPSSSNPGDVWFDPNTLTIYSVRNGNDIWNNTFENTLLSYYTGSYTAITGAALANDSWIDTFFPTADPSIYVVQSTYWVDSPGAESENPCVSTIKLNADYSVASYGELFSLFAEAAYATRGSAVEGNMWVGVFDTYSGNNWYGNHQIATLSTKVSNASNAIGIAQSTVSAGATLNIAEFGGISKVHSALTPNAIYYYDGAGALTTTSTSDSSNNAIGYALNGSDIFVTKGRSDSFLRASDLGFSVPRNSPLIPTASFTTTEMFPRTNDLYIRATSSVATGLLSSISGHVKMTVDKAQSLYWGPYNDYPKYNAPKSWSLNWPYAYGADDTIDAKIVTTSSDKFFIREKTRTTSDADYCGILADNWTNAPTSASTTVGVVGIYSNKAIVVTHSNGDSTNLTFHHVDYSSGAGVITQTTTLSTPSGASWNADYADPIGFVGWDPVNSKLLVMQWGAASQKWIATYNVDSSTGVVSFAYSSGTYAYSNSGTPMNEDALKYIPSLGCFILVTPTATWTTQYIVRKITINSSGVWTLSNSTVYSVGANFYRAVAHWRPDLNKLQVLATGTGSNTARMAFFDISGTPTLSSSTTWNAPTGYYPMSFAYVPGVPGGIIVGFNNSSAQAYILPPSTSSTSDYYGCETATRVMYNPFGGNTDYQYMFYDDNAKRLVTVCHNISYSNSSNIRTWFIERNSDISKPPFVDNVLIKTGVTTYSPNIPQNPSGSDGQSYGNRTHVALLTKTNGELSDYIVSTGRRTATFTKSDVMLYRLNLNPVASDRTHSRLLGVFSGNGGSVNTLTTTNEDVWVCVMGSLAPGLFAQSLENTYGKQYYRGVTYYLLPDGTITTDGTAANAIKFGKFVNNQSSVLGQWQNNVLWATAI